MEIAIYYEKSCTSVLVGRNASATGSPIHCHLEDNGVDDAVHLIYFPRMKHSGEVLKLSHVEIHQVPETFAYWGIVLAPGTPMSKKAAAEAPTSTWLLCGMNEYGVSIGANGVTSKEPTNKKKGLSFFEVIKLVMERAKNAWETVNLIGRLVEEYGQTGMGTNNTYCVGGSKACWIVEVAARNWIAKRCPDSDIIVYANQYLIETEWDLASTDLINYAKRQGWYNPASSEAFNFRRCYGDNLDTPYSVLREQRLKSLLTDKIGHITVQDIMKVTRDHYEGTEHSAYTTIDKSTSREPYPYPPHKSPYRTVCVPRTQASMVCTARSEIPREISNLMWLCMSSPCVSVYVPVYAGSSKAPKEYTLGEGKYDSASAWWAFDMLQRLVDDCIINRKYIREIWDYFERKELERQTNFEKVVLQVYEYNAALAKELLTEYTYEKLSIVLDIAKVLVSQGVSKY